MHEAEEIGRGFDARNGTVRSGEAGDSARDSCRGNLGAGSGCARVVAHTGRLWLVCCSPMT